MKDEIQKIRELTKEIQFAMMTTWGTEGLQSRPMTLLETDFDDSLWFFVSQDSTVAEDVEGGAEVNLAFAHPGKKSFVSVSGEAEILEDRAKIHELWKPLYQAFFPKGETDEKLRLLRVELRSADYWDSPSSKVVQLLGMAKAVISGKRAGEAGELGEHGHAEKGA